MRNGAAVYIHYRPTNCQPKPYPGTADSLFPRANLSNIVCSCLVEDRGRYPRHPVVDFRPQLGIDTNFGLRPRVFHRVLQQLISTRSKSGPSTWIKVSGSGEKD